MRPPGGIAGSQYAELTIFTLSILKDYKGIITSKTAVALFVFLFVKYITSRYDYQHASSVTPCSITHVLSLAVRKFVSDCMAS